MRASLLVFRRPLMVELMAVVLPIVACQNATPISAPDQTAVPQESVAFHAWAPGNGDTCPISVHQKYSVVGPDGKLYPTWHPPIDPGTGCSFGHEHGRDPHGSNLYQLAGDIPFGYANEQLDAYDPVNPRHEDHVGHKVEWENGIPMHDKDDPSILLGIQCDVLTKLHQGTHSKDAFTNNLHELAYHIKCTDGTEIHATLLTAIGTPGEFVRSCDHQAHVSVGPAAPANSPAGGGKRILPDRACADQYLFVPPGQQSPFEPTLHESWQTSSQIRLSDGRTIASFNPYFQVLNPARLYDPAASNNLGHTIDLCYLTNGAGNRVRGSRCTEVLALPISQLTFDDPRSPFDGIERVVDINANRLENALGPPVWYTDPFGKHGSTESFPGSIRQFVAQLNNASVRMNGPRIGLNRNYGSSEVHAPN